MELMRNVETHEPVNYIDEKQYVESCCKAGITNETNQKFLLKWLSELGIVFNYESILNATMVNELKVLRPEWITNGIYKIINSEQLKDYKGNIPIREVHNVLKVKPE